MSDTVYKANYSETDGLAGWKDGSVNSTPIKSTCLNHIENNLKLVFDAVGEFPSASSTSNNPLTKKIAEYKEDVQTNIESSIESSKVDLKNELIGSDEDNATSLTIKGSKKYTDDKFSSIKFPDENVVKYNTEETYVFNGKITENSTGDSKEINARIVHAVLDTSNENNTPMLGEFVIVDDGNNSVKLKIGDGKTIAKDLPYLITNNDVSGDTYSTVYSIEQNSSEGVKLINEGDGKEYLISDVVLLNNFELKNKGTAGFNHNINGTGNTAIGSGNSTIDGNYNFIIGTNNENTTNVISEYNSVVLIGENLQATQSNQIIFGKYNDTTSAAFIIANGSSNENRKNLLTISDTGDVITAGRLSLGGSPINDNDAVTKNYMLDKLDESMATSVTAFEEKLLTGTW